MKPGGVSQCSQKPAITVYLEAITLSPHLRDVLLFEAFKCFPHRPAPSSTSRVAFPPVFR
jgi:hypothetical protein